MKLGGLKLAEVVEWDVSNWSSALEFWSSHTTLDLSRARALELGARNGGLSLWLASLGARIVATDIGPPNETAVALHEKHGVSDRIEYESIDATRIPYTSEFDVVLFKSVLGAVGRDGGTQLQELAIQQMYKALKPGGELFFAENLVASPLHQLCRRQFVRWGTTWRYISIKEMQGFLRPFSSVRYATIGFAAAFGRTESQRGYLGKLDRTIFRHSIPESWRYIMFGVATK
jgi:SAM-dependent methyltransferase